MNIKPDEFDRMYNGVWEPDERYSALIEQLTSYYRETENASNKVAMGRWKEFKNWAVCCGYSNEEINSAKRNNQFRI
jgi:hypothetical protein